MSVAVVIPCYRVGTAVLDVIARVGAEVDAIYVVDDACPDGTAAMVEARASDPRVKVLRHAVNQGVGGAMITGYRAALADGHAVMVKIDGDGQMDPALIPRFIRPILQGKADYTKGNRFYQIESLRDMPSVRLFGNAVLSLLTKVSSGYWGVFDPTNGFTAIHGAVLAHIPLDKVSRDYFFESDMLFRLNTLRAVVRDIPMDAVYGEERSNLKIGRIVHRFLIRHTVNTAKRMFYNYILRDFQLASLALLLGPPLMLFGIVFGLASWIEAARVDQAATAGTVMLATLPIVAGLQLLLLAATYDIQNQPTSPVHPDLS